MTPALLHSLRQILGDYRSPADCERVVRVVLEHYREPSERMVSGWFEQSPTRLRAEWRAMVDVALSELSQTAES